MRRIFIFLPKPFFHHSKSLSENFIRVAKCQFFVKCYELSCVKLFKVFIYILGSRIRPWIISQNSGAGDLIVSNVCRLNCFAKVEFQWKSQGKSFDLGENWQNGLLGTSESKIFRFFNFLYFSMRLAMISNLNNFTKELFMPVFPPANYIENWRQDTTAIQQSESLVMIRRRCCADGWMDGKECCSW